MQLGKSEFYVQIVLIMSTSMAFGNLVTAYELYSMFEGWIKWQDENWEIKVKESDYLCTIYEHYSGLKLSLKLPRSHLDSTNCTQVDHMMQLKKQNQTDKPQSLIVLIHDLDHIFLYKNLKVKDIYSNNNQIRDDKFLGVFLTPIWSRSNKHNIKIASRNGRKKGKVIP